jgi:hypothetical protein
LLNYLVSGVENNSLEIYCLEILVIGSAAAFGSYPVNNLVRILNVTGFTMYAIGRIDLQTFDRVAFFDHFIHICRAKTSAGVIVFFTATIDADIGLKYL